MRDGITFRPVGKQPGGRLLAGGSWFMIASACVLREADVMTIAELPIPIDREKIAEFCRARGIRRLSLFGSILRDDFDPARSDVDVLAEFEPGASHRAGWDFFTYGEQLAGLLGHRVDFCTNPRPWLRPLVEKRALVIYDQQAP